MIRVAWSSEDEPDKVYHGNWFPEEDRPLLEEWINSLSGLYPMISHWIEELPPE